MKVMRMDQKKSPVNTSFLSHTVQFLLAQEKSPVTILRDTGASQSLVLADVLPFSTDSATGTSVLLQGVEFGTINVPLHKMTLKCNLVYGPVIVGVRPSLSVQGITVLLGNDLAVGRVLQSPRMSKVPQMMWQGSRFRNCFLPLL